MSVSLVLLDQVKNNNHRKTKERSNIGYLFFKIMRRFSYLGAIIMILIQIKKGTKFFQMQSRFASEFPSTPDYDLPSTPNKAELETKNSVSSANKYTQKVNIRDKIVKLRWDAPIVNSKHKMIYFSNPKVASTNFKRLMRRMEGLSYQNKKILKTLHDPRKNGLKYLGQFGRKEIQRMMTSRRWTKFVFLRDPKERFLSAFLDKSLRSSFFARRCCINMSEHSRSHCKENSNNFEYFFNRTKTCRNEHWDAQYNLIDPKWWPFISFIGNFSNLENDTRSLLSSIHIKDKSNLSLWSKYGANGWGMNNSQALFQRNEAPHETGAKTMVEQYYTPHLEKLVEKRFENDYMLLQQQGFTNLQ